MANAFRTVSAADPLDTSVPLIDLSSQFEQISDEIREAVDRVLSSQGFVLGEEVHELERQVADLGDSRFAIACASGTDALILSLLSLGIGTGDEVITTPFSFFATAGAIYRVGARPVFVDIDPSSYNLDPAKIEDVITDQTRAVMPVHLFGQCAEMEPIWRTAVRCGLTVVEDACQAIGARYRGRCAGVLGTVGCFSFFPTKNLGGAGDGGIITTDDAELADRLKRLRVHGDIGGYQHREVGMNSRLDALQAAILRAKIPHLHEWNTARQDNARRYGELFRYYGLLDAIELPAVLPERQHVFNQYTIRVRGGRRDEMITTLRENDIGCGVYYPIPLHLQECFAHLGYQEGDFPEAELAVREVVSLPIFPELGAIRQETVVRTIAAALGRLSHSLPRVHSHQTTFPRHSRRAA